MNGTQIGMNDSSVKKGVNFIEKYDPYIKHKLERSNIPARYTFNSSIWVYFKYGRYYENEQNNEKSFSFALKKGKSAWIYFEYREMLDGQNRS